MSGKKHKRFVKVSLIICAYNSLKRQSSTSMPFAFVVVVSATFVMRELLNPRFVVLKGEITYTINVVLQQFQD